jgi:uncharacterized RDD family membrane protein YckC
VTKTNTLQIRTPEGIVFSEQIAGPVPRFLAWLVDAFIIFALSSFVGMILNLMSLIAGGFIQAFAILAFFLLSVGYGIGLEWFWRGQTLGKRALRLRVVDAHGLRLKFSQIVIRNLLRVVDAMPALCYLVGGVACALSRRSQRLGDFAANTIVVHIPNVREPNLDQIMAGKYNSLRSCPHLEARLRQRVSPAEASLALQAIVRRDLLEPAARLELFEEIAAHFREKVQFPPEVLEGITDEQYVRNVVDVIYRESKTSPAQNRESESAAVSR